MKKFLLIAAGMLAGSTMLAQPAMATRTFADIYVDCGLGALLAPKTPVVAVITNITWDLGTTAILSNASSPESCKGESADAASLIHDSYEVLEMELAAGDGPYLDMLMALVEQDQTVESRHAFLTKVRTGLAEQASRAEYASMNHFQKSEALYNLVYASAGS